MMKNFLEKMIQQHDPMFRVDPAISSSALWGRIQQEFRARMRGWRLWLYGIRPRNMRLGRGVRFFNPRAIRFEGNNLIGDYSYIHALGNNSLRFGRNSGVGAFCQVVSSVEFNEVTGFIELGENAWIGDGSLLGGAGGLKIGNDTFTGQYVTFHPENHRFDDPDKLMRLQGVTRRGISVGNNCWIGAKVTITDGVTIGNNCVIAAGAVVTKDIPSNSLAGGVPAKIIRSIPCNLPT